MDTLEKIKKQNVFNSKVARKTFAAFIFCAILPLLAISTISMLYVGRQLEHEAILRLRQQCKNKGFYIYDRLTALEKDLKKISRLYLQGAVDEISSKPYDPIERDGSGWRRVFIRTPKAGTISLVDHTENSLSSVSEAAAPPQNDCSAISFAHNKDIPPAIFMTRWLDPEKPAKGVITGEIDPIFLWGIGFTGVLPPEFELAVLLNDQKTLISSLPGGVISVEFLEASRRDSFSGVFKSTIGGKKYFSSYWSLFLNRRFASPDWKIVVSQTKASIMAPLTNFRYIFFLLVLLTFWSIVLLSIHSIRRRTVPIDKLKSGAMRIAEGNFDPQITVTSKDEYQELAEAFNDMSFKLKQTQAIMLQAAKMSTFGQMGAGIVHEIGQPLSAISGYAELLQMDTSQEKSKHYAAIIFEQVHRLKDIIGKFRSFSRVADEKFTFLSISNVLKSTVELMTHQMKKSGVACQMNLADNLPPVLGDENALQQVFLNLINNAVDALDSKPKSTRKIYLHASATKNAIKIEIADNGCGIPAEVQDKIFEPFFTTKSKDKGTGLGLSIIGTILQKHNASITVESTVAAGTRFKILFPADSTQPT